MTLELNEITVLMAINSVGILALIFGFVYITADAILRGNKGNASPEQYKRS